MKRIFTLFISLLIISASLQAQLVAHYTTTHVTGDPSTALQATAQVVNTSSSPVSIRVQRSNTNTASGHTTYFCWGVNCYTPSVYLSPLFTLAAGDSTVLITYADPGGVGGVDMVNYQVFDPEDLSNKVIMDFTYEFTTAGVRDMHVINSYMTCSQSNAEDATNITYGINNFRGGKLVVRNLLGSSVKEIRLNDKQGVLSVSTADFPSGIYMYLLYDGDEPVATRKMVISHR